MKKVLACILIGTAVWGAPLEPGKNYDFIQKNGQNVLGAELLSESETEFVVKLKYLPKPLILNKNNLAHQPGLSKLQPEPKITGIKPDFRSDFVLNASVGVSYLTFGPLSSIFRTGYQASLGTDWLFFPEPFYRIRALSVLATFSGYQQSPRRIQLVSAYAGPKFILWSFPSFDAALFASPLVGISYASLRGYTFSDDYATLAAMGIISFKKRYAGLILGGQVYVNYLFDNSLNFFSTGISVSVLYPLGSARLF